MSPKKLREVGEFKLIEKIRMMIKRGKGVVVGIGDDAAVLDFEGRKLLATCDMLVEGVHFIPSIEPEDLGWKALAVSLSDISAMGGEPLFALLSLSLPPSLEEEWLERFLKGWEEISEIFDVFLVGGNISEGREIAIDSIVLGEVATPVLRSEAREGDGIFVTGCLGDSAAGLYCLKRGITDYPALLKKHLRPLPRVNEGERLGSTKSIHSMIDISDGFIGDLARICEGSGKGAVIFAEKIPLSPDLLTFCQEFALPPLEFALFGGEDYELLFTADADFSQELGFPIYRVGEIREGRELVLLEHGKEKRIEKRGFEHFKENL